MIKSLTVTNYLGKSLKITLTEAMPSHGLLIQSITGIGPADAELNYSDYAINDGSEFNSARLGKRSIQITFMLTANEDVTVEQARHITYQFFPTKKDVRLLFETDERTLYCYGRVEHNTPDIFKQQELATIDITCGDPYFYKIVDGYEDNVVSAALIEGAFSSEYASPSDPSDDSLSTYFTNEGDPNIEFGTYLTTGAITENLKNEGDAEVGFNLKIAFNGPIEGDIIIANANQETIKIRTSVIEELIGSSISQGDVIKLSTDPKYRYLTLTKSGEEMNVLNALDFDNLTWLTLSPGDNLITYYVDNGEDTTEATFSYKILYLGV